MKLHPRVTKTAVELVKRFEGLRRRAARLPDGGWTIGYGHTLTAREGSEVTPEEAELLLHYDLSEVATKVEAWTFVPLSQNQFEALIAFAFNIGLENFRRSTVLKRVNEGQQLQAAAAMELWRKAEVGGEDLVADALVRRRAAEKAHYLTPPEGFAPSPSQVLRPTFDYSVIEAASQSYAARRTSVVETPLEGEETSAHVQRPAETAPAAPAPESVSDGGLEPAGLSEPPAGPTDPEPPAAAPGVTPALAEVAPALAASIAEAVVVPVLHAPASEPEPAPESEPKSASELVVSDAEVLPSPPPPGAGGPFAVSFRGFEPPPRRFGRADAGPPPTAANEFLAEASANAPATHPGDFNLFDRPLAPPEPRRAEPLPADPPGADEDVIKTIPVRRSAPSRSILQDRTVLFSAIGLLGVGLFALAIFTMLLGKPTLWHLLVGALGVVLIIPASVFFLMRRVEGLPASHSHEQANRDPL